MKHGIKSERNKEMIRKVLGGDTLRQVGVDNGISAPTVRTIFYQAMCRIFDTDSRKIKEISLANFRDMRYYLSSRL